MIDKIYYYKTIYNEIEDEIISLTQNILFCDDQMKVFSSKIANLILRCGAEIETLFKDIYKQEISKELPTTGECVKVISVNYLLERKKIHISNLGMYFEEKENLLFYPFSDNNYFYDNYCALKHDLLSNMCKANVRTLLMASAAMFILLYFYEGLFTNPQQLKAEDYSGMQVKSKIFSLPIAFVSFSSEIYFTIDRIEQKEIKELETCASMILMYNGENPLEYEIIKNKVLQYNFSITGNEIPIGIGILSYVKNNFTKGDEQAAANMLSRIYDLPGLGCKYRTVNNFGKIDALAVKKIKKKLLYHRFGLV